MTSVLTLSRPKPKRFPLSGRPLNILNINKCSTKWRKIGSVSWKDTIVSTGSKLHHCYNITVVSSFPSIVNILVLVSTLDSYSPWLVKDRGCPLNSDLSNGACRTLGTSYLCSTPGTLAWYLSDRGSGQRGQHQFRWCLKTNTVAHMYTFIYIYICVCVDIQCINIYIYICIFI